MRLDRIAWALVVAGALLVSACYPTLDWREVASAKGGYSILMPAQQEHAEREIVLGGLALSMSMASVSRDGMAFGAAHADIPSGHARPAELLAAARDALVRNIDGRITSARDVTMGGATGMEFSADGRVGDRPMRLAARVFVADSRFYQVAVVGQRDRLSDADVDLFLRSFRLLRK